MTYEQRLLNIGIILQEPLKQVKTHHSMRCAKCNHIWSATPLSKIQAHKKYGQSGCPQCEQQRRNESQTQIRQQNLYKLRAKGLEILSDWDGTSGVGKESSDIAVTVRNTRCNHIFTSRSKNLLNRNVSCPACAREVKTANLNKSSKDRSDEWKKTADIWQHYKSKVTKLTKLSYKQNKQKINPNNLPTGRAGTEGAYHLDHIVPIRYCFENYIPEDICAHPDNLQMLYWTDNVGSRDKLKEYIPEIFVDFIVKL